MPAQTKLRALLVDDEDLARHALRELLKAHAEVEIAGECANGFDPHLDGGARVWPRRMRDEAKVIHAPCPPAGRRSHQAGLPIQASTEYAERG